jgi:hypothetical protein
MLPTTHRGSRKRLSKHGTFRAEKSGCLGNRSFYQNKIFLYKNLARLSLMPAALRKACILVYVAEPFC